jgi:hypothetical protein
MSQPGLRSANCRRKRSTSPRTHRVPKGNPIRGTGEGHQVGCAAGGRGRVPWLHGRSRAQTRYTPATGHTCPGAQEPLTSSRRCPDSQCEHQAPDQ